MNNLFFQIILFFTIMALVYSQCFKSGCVPAMCPSGCPG
ncbi:hypothetical protein Mgra_00008769 [Meloidogyne graminicola]|uniref:Uncharacterized protein n=1 Tax=Meloidogyne graminicola TaxID=189291 RepID=A0A8S9ZET4_9BILA|nr:hypothetical protein Mgra_00008769 [Meloidogyne graminicola]